MLAAEPLSLDLVRHVRTSGIRMVVFMIRSTKTQWGDLDTVPPARMESCPKASPSLRATSTCFTTLEASSELRAPPQAQPQLQSSGVGGKQASGGTLTTVQTTNVGRETASMGAHICRFLWM